MLRVLYITLPSLLDVSLSFTKAIAPLLEFHMVMQITKNSWQSSLFEKHPVTLPPRLSPAEQVMKEFPCSIWENWHSTISFEIASFNGNSALNFESIRTGLAILEKARRLKPDIIHFETTSGRLLWTLPLMRNIAPIVISVHDPHPHSGESPLKKKIIRFFSYRIGDRYILHNRFQLDQFCREYKISPEKVDYTPLGEYSLYRAYLDLLAPVDPSMMLFFGRLSPYKGLETLFKAAPLVCQRLHGARFVVAGRPIPGYQLPPIPDLPNSGKLEIIQDYIPNHRLAELFQQAAMIICPYTDATQSGVVMTAYAFWKPVIATRVGGLPEYIEDGITGALVEPENPEQLANSILEWHSKLINNDGQQNIANAIHQKCLEEFSWNKIADQTLEIYQRTIETRHRRR